MKIVFFFKSHMLKELQNHTVTRAEDSQEDVVVTFHQHVHAAGSRALTAHLSIITLYQSENKWHFGDTATDALKYILITTDSVSTKQ